MLVSLSIINLNTHTARLAAYQAPSNTDLTNQTFFITGIGPGGGGRNEGPYPFFCYTSDTSNVVWQFPNGSNVPLLQSNVTVKPASGNQLVVVEASIFGANGGVALLRGPDYLSPTGDYCCVRTPTGERRCVTFSKY